MSEVEVVQVVEAEKESEEAAVESGSRSSFVLFVALACLQSRRRVLLPEELGRVLAAGAALRRGGPQSQERAEAEASRRLSRGRRGPRRGEASGRRSAEAEAPRSVLLQVLVHAVVVALEVVLVP